MGFSQNTVRTRQNWGSGSPFTHLNVAALQIMVVFDPPPRANPFSSNNFLAGSSLAAYWFSASHALPSRTASASPADHLAPK